LTPKERGQNTHIQREREGERGQRRKTLIGASRRVLVRQVKESGCWLFLSLLSLSDDIFILYLHQ